eukprot:SAG31_NODE_587_length_13828_cov_2.438779_1_plen_71_part_10
MDGTWILVLDTAVNTKFKLVHSGAGIPTLTSTAVHTTRSSCLRVASSSHQCPRGYSCRTWYLLKFRKFRQL